MIRIDYKKVSRRIVWMIIVLLSLVILYSGIKSVIYIKDGTHSRKELDEIKSLVEIDENDDNVDDEKLINEGVDKNQKYEPDTSKNASINKYLNINPLDVDISILKKKNNDAVAWLKVNNTNVNYPVVQGQDNKFYLNHSFDKSYNGAGWVFADYRNNFSTLDRNTIIYAHGRFDSAMFGSLKKTFSSEWQSNPQNYIISLSSENENTLWQIFSIYHIPTTTDYLKIQFATNTEFLEFSQTLIQRSVYNFNTSLDENDKILTLSTCLNSYNKVVVHAKLVKSDIK